MVQIKRATKETNIVVSIPAPGTQLTDAPVHTTTLEFLDHMLATLSRYSGLNFSVQATGDLSHHISEDVAITLGVALRKATPDTCARYGVARVPMDDALVEVTVDLVERNFYQGPVPTVEYEHFFRSLTENFKCNVHVRVLRGVDEHHIIEAAFKGLGMCLRQAMQDSGSVFSTKGAAEWTIDE
ncbi:MAG TPA: imidazoleglycerol-phosphate dehydratase [Acidimicrobiia bacterium]|nr:imidazoleglycerol-phosphate dehydratase [Acidimicrobiia bacterium]